MKKTYLCKNQKSYPLVEHLLSESGKDFLVDVEILDLSVWISSFIKNPSLYEVYDAIKTLNLHDFKDSIHDTGFLKEILHFKKEVDAFELDVDALNISEELKEILHALPSFGYAKLYQMIEEHSFEDFYVVEGAYDFLEELILARIIKKGAKHYSFASYEHKDFIATTLNERQEIESLIQYLILEKIDPKKVGIITCASNPKLLRATLKRYDVPHTFLHDERKVMMASKMQALLDYYVEPTLVNYQKILAHNLFAPSNPEVFTYLERHFSPSSELLCDFTALKEEEKYYQILEEKANLPHCKTYPFVQKMMGCDSLKEAILLVFDLLKEEGKDAVRLKRFFEERSDFLTEEYYFLLKEELSSLTRKESMEDGILIANLNDGMKREYLFVLDASQNDFPGFQTKTGLCNEAALSGSGYPSIEMRYQSHQRMLEYLSKSKETIYLCPKSAYDGKDVEMASCLEDFASIALPLYEKEESFRPRHELSPESAKSAFFQEDILRGSISSFEKYMRCPYSYFLNYCLKLYEPKTFELSPALAGTILHEVLEKLIARYHKDYLKASKEEIKEILKPSFDRLYTLFPKEREWIGIVEENFLDAILLEFTFLKKMESETDFIPEKVEYPFEEMFLDAPDCKIKLKGFIDRIDETGDYFRILDYKTSRHTINVKEVEKGLQLQLLTYLLIYQKHSGKTPAGAYYLNINHPKNNLEHYRYGVSNGLSKKENDAEKDFLQSHRLQGMTFNDFDGLDYQYENVMTTSKKGISKAYLLDFDDVKEGFMSIYVNIYSRLKAGDISLTPVDGACTYCNYRRICHFKGGEFYERETIAQIKKEDNDEAE